MIKECVNDKLDDDNRKNLIKENETKLNDKDEDDTDINEEKGKKG